MLPHFHRWLHSTSPSTLRPRRALLVVAASTEVAAVLRGLDLGPTQSTPIPPITSWILSPLRDDLDLVVTGIGKSNAAAAVASVLNPACHALVLNVGIAGALPTLDSASSESPNLTYASPLGGVHAASACVFADEGLETPEGFIDCPALGFPLGDFPGSAVPTDPGLTATLAPLASIGPIATVSTCSGTNALAQRTAQRTKAAVEGMEGAAIALVAHHHHIPMTELRVVSNTTGDRSRQQWQVRPALSVLEDVIRQLFPKPR